MNTMSDSELLDAGFMLLAKTFGDVNAERFIVLNNREPQDYTRWRASKLHLGNSVHEVAQLAHAMSAQYEKARRTVFTH